MNSSSSTKINLKTNKVFIEVPRIKMGKSWLFVALITLLVFTLLVKLGFWQLDRAQQKAAWQQELTLRQSAAPLGFSQMLALEHQGSLTGYRINVTATPIEDKVFLLDNQVLDGRVGYLAYQALEVSAELPWMLLELGFIESLSSRNQLPRVDAIKHAITLAGRVYQKQVNPLSSALMAEAGWPKRIQNLNFNELSALLAHPMTSAVLQPDTLPNSQLPHPWQPIPLSPQKHRGYALQWFSMAGVLVFIILALLIRTLKTNIKNKQLILKQSNSRWSHMKNSLNTKPGNKLL